MKVEIVASFGHFTPGQIIEDMPDGMAMELCRQGRVREVKPVVIEPPKYQPKRVK